MNAAGLISVVGMEASTNPYVQQLNTLRLSGRGNCGTSHDGGANWFFPSLPEGWESATHELLNLTQAGDGSSNLPDLQKTVGKVLTDDNDTLLVTQHSTWVKLYCTPLYRLWCGQFHDKDSFKACYNEVFGEDPDGRYSLENSIIRAKERIQGMFTDETTTV